MQQAGARARSASASSNCAVQDTTIAISRDFAAMDPLLPFRPLSPGTRSPKFNLRTRHTKLSLKSMKVKGNGGHVGQGNKENGAPVSILFRDRRNYASQLDDTDLMTSDESDASSPRSRCDARKHSVMSLNTQDSTFSLPAAESTRCELPASKLTGLVESTGATLHTADNGSFSSNSTLFFTACPLSVPCDESIVCISDSSPEPEKRTVKMVTDQLGSVLISSDESDDGLGEVVSNIKTLRLFTKKKDVKLCETVILETSSDESDSEVGSGDDHVIPASDNSDIESSSDSSKADRLYLGTNIVIPPSPISDIEKDVNLSLISEESCIRTGQKSYEEVPESYNSRFPDSNSQSDVKARSLKPLNSLEMSAKFDSNESWKEGFRLVMPESSACSEDIEAKNITAPSISKEKYNDIARWLSSGRKSPESISKDSSPKTPKLPNHQNLEHIQLSRLSSVRRASLDSESDDNFNALIESVRKKRNEQQINSVKDKSFINEESFIDDGCASDVVESPSFNIYHSDLAKSIKAEVKSVKKSVKSMRNQVIGHLYDSDSEVDDTPTRVIKPKRRQKSNVKILRKYTAYRSGSDDSDVELEDQTNGRKVVSNSDSEPCSKRKEKGAIFRDDSALSSEDERKGKIESGSNSSTGSRNEFRKISPPLTSKVKKRETAKNNKNIEVSSGDSSDRTKSSLDWPEKLKVSDWRNNASPSHSSSESSLSPPSKPKKPARQPTIPQKLPTKVQKKALPPLTPKQMATLKSPKTPYSPIRTFLSSLSGPTHDPGVRDHPEAAIYNKSFKTKKEELTRRLFKLFNREVFDKRLPDDILLEWNARLVRTAGLCYCKLIRKGEVTSRTSKIALSSKVITSPDRLRDTLIHEMCHAAVWLLNNVSGGHGPFWKAWAQKAMKRFPELPPIERCHSYDIETKYTYKCTKCGYSFGRHSKSLDTDKKRCGYCYGTFEVFLSSSGQNNKEKSLKTPKAPSAFALFVKENYGLLKQDNSHLKHGDIMKKLGEKFSALKVKQSNC